MRSEWEQVKLGDVIQTNLSSYSVNDKWNYVNYLDTGNITRNQIFEIQKIDLHSEKLPSRAKRKVNKNSIIYSTVRPNQRHYGIMSNIPDNFLVSTGFTVIDVNESKIDPYFIYYFLSLDSNVEHLHAVAEQSVSTYPSINTSDIAKLEICLPPLDEQKKIAYILKTLDEKIELNNQINKNLEEQAQAIFKERFAKKDDQLPEEWKMGRLDEFFDISIGKTPPRKEQEWFSSNPEDNTWVSISDMGNCGMFISDSSEYLTNEAVQKFNIVVVPANTLLLSFKLTVGRIVITTKPMTTNEAIAHIKYSDRKTLEYLYYYLKNFNFETLGSTSSIATAINSKIIKAMLFIMPENKVLEKFHFLVYPMFEKIAANSAESVQLAQIRDTLLPKLMSGEKRL